MYQILGLAGLGFLIYLLAQVGCNPIPERKSPDLLSSGKEAIKEIRQFGKDFANNARNNLEGVDSRKTIEVIPDANGVLVCTMTNNSSERVTYTIDGVKRHRDPGGKFSIRIEPDGNKKYPECVRITAYLHTSRITGELLYYPNTGKVVCRKN